MTKIAFVSTYVPQKCGLATYTFNLRQAIQGAKNWRGADPVIVMTDSDTDAGNDPLFLPLAKHDEEAYVKMARRINQSDIDVVSLQHEFGIFGGEAGAYILTLIRNLKKPLITTFHTVFEHPMPPYAAIQQEIAERSSKILVMNRKAISFLHQSFHIPKEKIIFIPHGAPQGDAESRLKFREQLGWKDRKVLMTFGLLSRGKGIELMLKVLPQVAKKVPNVLYAIVGQTHPGVVKFEGERYREELREMINRLGIDKHTVMINHYLEESDLIKHLIACDVYVTPYPGMQQITSGTLAYAVGLGRPILSTPYCYAQDLLADYPELLIPYDDEAAWSEKIISLLENDLSLKSWNKKIAAIGKHMHWAEVGKQHYRLFAEVSHVELAKR